jgi:hypothetical protein
MLMITDFGCSLHQLCHLKFFGFEARMMKDVLSNLQSDGKNYTYICARGFNHCLRVEPGVPDTLADQLCEQERSWGTADRNR